MKVQTLAVITVALVLSSTLANAADNTCEKNFGLDVAYCAQTLNNTKFSSPKEKGEWQKACVDQAKINKMTCEAGGTPPTCSQQCQINYDASTLSCHQVWDPLIASCDPTDSNCIVFLTHLLDSCLSTSLVTLNACLAACPVQ